MNAYELPTSLCVGGVEYSIRSDFRAVLDVLVSANDPELDQEMKAWVMLQIMFPDLEQIPEEHLSEACTKVCEFIDCGQKDDGKPKPRLLDWEQDGSMIVPAVNNVAHTEIRALPYLHWWTFWGYFMQIGESLMSSVISIRQKKAKREKLEKWEEKFYKENRDLIDLKTKQTEAMQQEKESILKWLD